MRVAGAPKKWSTASAAIALEGFRVLLSLPVALVSRGESRQRLTYVQLPT